MDLAPGCSGAYGLRIGLGTHRVRTSVIQPGRQTIQVVVKKGRVHIQRQAAEAWPSIRWTAFTLAPELIASEAAVCRSS
jgi:hypothetical protein